MIELLGIWISAFLTLAIFSFLYKDNPIYKFAEHLFIGLSAGYAAVVVFKDTILPNFWHEVWPAIISLGGEGKPERLGAGILGVMLLLRLSKQTSWVSRWPLALVIGTFAALRLVGYAQSDLIAQVNGTMIPIIGNNLPVSSWNSPSVINNLLLIIGVFTVLIYFFFSVEQKGPIKRTSQVGIGFLMITFGSSFGFTVLGRISLLIGRVQDLYRFGTRSYGYASIVCAVIIIIYLVYYEFYLRKRT